MSQNFSILSVEHQLDKSNLITGSSFGCTVGGVGIGASPVTPNPVGARGLIVLDLFRVFSPKLIFIGAGGVLADCPNTSPFPTGTPPGLNQGITRDDDAVVAAFPSLTWTEEHN